MTDTPSFDTLLLMNRAATVSGQLPSTLHDLNNLLMVVSASVELLDAMPLSAPAKSRLSTIQGYHARAIALSQGLMQFARQPLDAPGRIDVHGLVTESMHMREWNFKRAGITVGVGRAPAPPLITAGNGALVQQAVLNLLTNAEQALAGRRDGVVNVAVSEEAGGVAIRVSDNGPGVPSALRDRVFDPFFTTDRERAGLGLFVSRGIAQRVGGALDLEPTSSGAMFVLRLPRAPRTARTGGA